MTEEKSADTDGERSPMARVRDAFDHCMDLAPDERAPWIDHHVTDADDRTALHRLLAAVATDGALDLSSAERAARIGVEPTDGADGWVGQSIGPFKLVRLLGQGGMATVFLGERSTADFRQQVAVKLLRRGLYSEIEQRLFRRERQALAALSHPNVAHLIDGGITEAGIPYIVIEFVDGTNLLEYVGDNQLDLPARLRLFVVVCRAVAAAHRLLIVHRDIKPGNVLVDSEGNVKLLDFGIAKLLGEPEDGATRSGIAPMTPAYAAPEQIAGGTISTATDVYALGVLLHELILGERPSIIATEARKPSASINELATDLWSLPMPRAALRSALRGDLDNILLKALAFDAERRYASAAEIADDVERHLGAQPVNAHPPSNWYRTRKFVQRHRGGVATTFAFLVAIIASLGVALWQAHVARAEAERAEAMRSFIVESFAEAKPGTPGTPPNIIEVVEQAIEAARSNAQMSPRVRIELIGQLGNVLRGQGRVAAALELLRGNYEQARSELGDDDAVTLAVGHEFVMAQLAGGESPGLRTLIDRLVAASVSHRTGLRSRLLRDSARLATLEDDAARALVDARAALALARDANDDGELSSVMFEVGNMQLSTADIAGAITTFEETLALRTRYLGPRHVNVAAVHTALSRAYRRHGDPERAVQSARAALEIGLATLPPEHFRLGFQYNALAIALVATREFASAQEAAANALRINRAAHGNLHVETINALSWVGRIALLLDDPSSATAAFAEGLQLAVERVSEAHADSAALRAWLGTATALAGACAEALPLLQSADDAFTAAARPDPGRHALALENRIRTQLLCADDAAALLTVDRLATRLTTQRVDDPYWPGRVDLLRAMALQALRRWPESDASYAAAAVAISNERRADPMLAAEVATGRAEIAANIADSDRGARIALARESLRALPQPPAQLRERIEALDTAR